MSHVLLHVMSLTTHAGISFACVRKFEEVRNEMDKCAAEIKTSADSRRNCQDLLQKISIMQQ